MSPNPIIAKLLLRHARGPERALYGRGAAGLPATGTRRGHGRTRLKSELTERLLPDIPENEGAAKELRDIEGVARGALREVREAVAGYRQTALRAELAEAREMLLAARIECCVEDDIGQLPSETDAVLAWAVREGVTNVVRHSRARRCEIRLTRRVEEVLVAITDDGRGPPAARQDTEGKTAGSGLSGLAERVASFSGAKFEAGPLPRGGFRLLVVLPLPTAATPGAARPTKVGPEPAGEEGRR
jgi:two-component system sensor histidine kinase DesK